MLVGVAGVFFIELMLRNNPLFRLSHNKPSLLALNSEDFRPLS
jgi:hypothetical protein